MTLICRKKWLFFTKRENALLLNHMLDFVYGGFSFSLEFCELSDSLWQGI
jgi:hypothetical protein